ncbi:TPA: restriction endonuclease subunit S [Vibrio parahaemolyticus]
MSDWYETRLGDIADICIGGTPSRAEASYWASTGEEGFPWVSISDLKGRVVSNTAESITALGARNSNVKLVPCGTIMMSFKLSLGRIAFAGRDIYTNEAIASFEVDTDKIDKTFLFYQLPEVVKLAITDTAIKGATLNKAKLNELVIPHPELVVQSKIAEILSTIDNQIDATQALIDKYTAIKQGMMADLFSRGIDPETKALRPTFEEAPELYHKTPLGMLPKGWETKSLDSVVESLVDGPFGSNLKSEHYVDSSPYRVVRLQNIVEYQYNDENKAFIPVEHFEFLKRNTVYPGDVLIAGLGEERYPVGRSCCYPADFPPAVNKADCFRARGINGVLENTYLMLFLNSEVARHQIRRLEQGVTRPRVNTGNLKKIIVCLPSIEEQKLATEKYQSIQNVVGGLEAELKKLTSQKAGLMQDLLTGKVPVPV